MIFFFQNNDLGEGLVLATRQICNTKPPIPSSFSLCYNDLRGKCPKTNTAKGHYMKTKYEKIDGIRFPIVEEELSAEVRDLLRSRHPFTIQDFFQILERFCNLQNCRDLDGDWVGIEEIYWVSDTLSEKYNMQVNVPWVVKEALREGIKVLIQKDKEGTIRLPDCRKEKLMVMNEKRMRKLEQRAQKDHEWLQARFQEERDLGLRK